MSWKYLDMSTEWGALSGLFPIDDVLQKWLRYKATESALYSDDGRFSHQRIDDLFANPISADKGAQYAKYLYMDLSTLSPHVSGKLCFRSCFALLRSTPESGRNTPFLF